MNFGVPQGSMLYPTLFILYIIDMQIEYLLHFSNINCYTDDSTADALYTGWAIEIFFLRNTAENRSKLMSEVRLSKFDDWKWLNQKS